jgi:hypothetical protein
MRCTRDVEVVLTADRWLGLLLQGRVARMSKQSDRAVGTNNKGFVSCSESQRRWSGCKELCEVVKVVAGRWSCSPWCVDGDAADALEHGRRLHVVGVRTKTVKAVKVSVLLLSKR